MSDANVTVLGDLADWYDLQLQEDDDYLVKELAESRGWGPNGVSAWGFAGYVTVMTFGKFAQTFVDSGRFLNGIAEGTWRGVGKDALRLLNVVPLPIGKLAGITRILEVEQQAGTMSCSIITSINALRRTGQRFFVSTSSLAQATGKSWPKIVQDGVEVAEYGKIIDELRAMGISATRSIQTASTLQDIEALVRAKPPGVTMWAMYYWDAKSAKWAGHVIYSTMSKGAVIYQDTNKAFYTSANAVAKAFPYVQVAAGAPITYIPNATLIESSILSAPLVAGADAIADIFLPVAPVPANSPAAKGETGPPTTTVAH